ncbi:MAG: hypothetical protein NVSMB31_06170 [Vulcanimicrobiaceae bacterium]
MLVFARCAGFVFRAPGFSHPSVPPAVRAGLAFVLAMGLAPGVHSLHAVEGLSFVLALATELAIGAAIGIGASVLYDGAYAGGRALDDYVGIRGSVPNAAIAASSGFGRIWSMTFLAGFFLLDGYHLVITVFADGFVHLPPGSLLTAVAWSQFAISLPMLILKAALLIAGPAIALIFVIQFALGALARAIPRFQSFTLSFPIIFAAALVVTSISVPLLLPLSGHAWLQLPFLRVK